MNCVCDPDKPVYGAACGHHTQMCRNYAESLGLEHHSGMINILKAGQPITREEAIDLVGTLNIKVKELTAKLERIAEMAK